MKGLDSGGMMVIVMVVVVVLVVGDGGDCDGGRSLSRSPFLVSPICFYSFC